MNEAKSSILHVLLDGVSLLAQADLHLGIGATRDLHDHVEDCLLLVGVKGDVMQEGHELSIPL